MAGQQVTPAALWRAFFIFTAVGWLAGGELCAQRQYRPPPGYVQLGKPDQAEGARILQEFHGMGIAGEYYLGFQLRVMPRRGAERTHAGQMWGSRNEQGAVTRVALNSGADERRLLIQNGPKPAVWSWHAGMGEKVELLGVAELFAPLAETDLTAFDLQMPFLHWTDFVYEGLARVRGRPSHQFLLYPPEEFAAKYTALSGVRIYLDTQFGALVQSALLGDKGQLLKMVTLLELKTIADQTIPKTFDVRDETTRNKTRFSVTAVALSQNFVGDMFSPAALAQPLAAPSADRLTRIQP